MSAHKGQSDSRFVARSQVPAAAKQGYRFVEFKAGDWEYRVETKTVRAIDEPSVFKKRLQ